MRKRKAMTGFVAFAIGSVPATYFGLWACVAHHELRFPLSLTVYIAIWPFLLFYKALSFFSITSWPLFISFLPGIAGWGIVGYSIAYMLYMRERD